MNKIIVLQGLIASGKSTWAKEQCSQPNWVRVNKDDLRSMLYSGEWSKQREAQTLAAQSAIIVSLMDKGCNIVVDDTNLNPYHIDRIKGLIEYHNEFNEPKYELEVKTFPTPLNECIQRDSKRENPVGEKVIREMFNKYFYTWLIEN